MSSVAADGRIRSHFCEIRDRQTHKGQRRRMQVPGTSLDLIDINGSESLAPCVQLKCIYTPRMTINCDSYSSSSVIRCSAGNSTYKNISFSNFLIKSSQYLPEYDLVYFKIHEQDNFYLKTSNLKLELHKSLLLQLHSSECSIVVF